MKNKFIGMTLIELLVGLALLSIIVLGLAQIDLFSRSQVLRTDRQAVLQNELSFILSHMSKTGMRAIGNEVAYGTNTVVMTDHDGNSIDLKIYIDGDNDGRYTDTENNPPINSDHAIAYQLGTNPNAGPNQPSQYHIRYCPRCRDITACSNNNQCSLEGFGWEVLGTHIVTGNSYVINKPVNASSQLNNNYVYVEMTACWDPDGNPDPCGTLLNPRVTMHTVINFPMVSVH